MQVRFDGLSRHGAGYGANGPGLGFVAFGVDATVTKHSPSTDGHVADDTWKPVRLTCGLVAAYLRLTCGLDSTPTTHNAPPDPVCPGFDPQGKGVQELPGPYQMPP